MTGLTKSKARAASNPPKSEVSSTPLAHELLLQRPVEQLVRRPVHPERAQRVVAARGSRRLAE